ncbi:MAG TPA: calcium/proton exchanger [Thermoanaerobaculia bacterium]|nr:calcium/proton exchanger [Thermoanaerobaculia bacterium]
METTEPKPEPSFARKLLKPRLDWLLVCLPILLALELFAHDRHTIIFFVACAAVIPLAGWLGRATEHLAERTSEGIGGLLNATFGNAAEMIIAISALRRGLNEVVKASITGSIIGNILLVLGVSFLVGGVKWKEQRFNAVGARVQATLLTLAAVALVAPAAFHYIGGPRLEAREEQLSLAICGVLIVAYGLGLFFTLHTHKKHFSGHSAEVGEAEREGHGEPWSLGRSFAVLLGSTALIALVAEVMVASVEATADHLGMNDVFIGVMVVAVVGNAAEHSTAILMAAKNRMDLALTIAVGSSIQIALFVAPVLIFLSFFVAPTPINLVFTPAEVLAVVIAVAATSQIAGDGESNWLEGVLLLAVYIVLGIVFFFLPV